MTLKPYPTLDENFPDKNEYLPSSLIFPPPTCTTDEERDYIAKQLFSMKVAPGALLVANLALYELLSDLGIGCDVMVGHSFGENAALTASGRIPRMEQGQLINKFRHLNQIYTDLGLWIIAVIKLSCLAVKQILTRQPLN